MSSLPNPDALKSLAKTLTLAHSSTTCCISAAVGARSGERLECVGSGAQRLQGERCRPLQVEPASLMCTGRRSWSWRLPGASGPASPAVIGFLLSPSAAVERLCLGISMFNLFSLLPFLLMPSTWLLDIASQYEEGVRHADSLDTGCERCMMVNFKDISRDRRPGLWCAGAAACKLQSSNNILNLESLRGVVRAITMSH